MRLAAQPPPFADRANHHNREASTRQAPGNIVAAISARAPGWDKTWEKWTFAILS